MILYSLLSRRFKKCVFFPFVSILLMQLKKKSQIYVFFFPSLLILDCASVLPLAVTIQTDSGLLRFVCRAVKGCRIVLDCACRSWLFFICQRVSPQRWQTDTSCVQTEGVKDPALPSDSLTHKRDDSERIHGEEKEGAVPKDDGAKRVVINHSERRCFFVFRVFEHVWPVRRFCWSICWSIFS